MRCALKNPLGIARLVNDLEANLGALDLKVTCGSDMGEFAHLKKIARGFEPGPMHDHSVCDFSGERAFWMTLSNAADKVVGMQAFRYDVVDISLAEWCSNYMIGVYMRRKELMVPSHTHPPAGSIAEKLRGGLAYHGELWIDGHVKSQHAVDLFTRMGSYLAMLKWNPDAIWALTCQRLASRGYMGRFNFSVVERGFLRWAWHSEGVDAVEYLAVADRQYLEQSVEEDIQSGQFRNSEKLSGLSFSSPKNGALPRELLKLL